MNGGTRSVVVAPALGVPIASQPWYAELNRYHGYLLIVAALGWMPKTRGKPLPH